MAKSGLADRLYRGEANLDIIGRRNQWFAIAGILVLIAVGSFIVRGFDRGIEFSGGTQFIMPASVGTQADAQSAVSRAIAAGDVPADTKVSIAQKVGNGGEAPYTVGTSSPTAGEAPRTRCGLPRCPRTRRPRSSPRWSPTPVPPTRTSATPGSRRPGANR